MQMICKFIGVDDIVLAVEAFLCGILCLMATSCGAVETSSIEDRLAAAQSEDNTPADIAVAPAQPAITQDNTYVFNLEWTERPVR